VAEILVVAKRYFPVGKYRCQLKQTEVSAFYTCRTCDCNKGVMMSDDYNLIVLCSYIPEIKD
jgi:hypothetical protein